MPLCHILNHFYMKLSPDELQQNGYILLDKMDHRDLVPFVKLYLNKRTWSSAMYYLSMFTSFAILLICFGKFYSSGMINLPKGLAHVSLGVVCSLLLIPFHELLHAFAYKLQGAKQTSYDMNLRKFYFLAIADKFVASRREFQIVALFPFVVISLALLFSALIAGETWKITLLTTLTIHSMFCSGDFALLSYFEVNRGLHVVTYDDKEHKISFFYGKEK